MRQDGGFFSRSIWIGLCLGLLLPALPGSLALGQFVAARHHSKQGQDPNAPRDRTQAWKWLDSTLKSAGVSKPRLGDGIVTGTAVGNKTLTIHLAMVTSVTGVNCPVAGRCSVQWYEFPWPAGSPGTASWVSIWFPVKSVGEGTKFRSALFYLAQATQSDADTQAAAALEDFKPKAEAWRKMAVKPAMPEPAREHQVLAEYAFKHKDVVKAMEEYSQALEIFPYWPEGHYDLATMAAEIGGRPGYRIAISHMQSYLALTPDAPDAQAANDSIIVWKDKMTGGSSSPSPTASEVSASGIK